MNFRQAVDVLVYAVIPFVLVFVIFFGLANGESELLSKEFLLIGFFGVISLLLSIIFWVKVFLGKNPEWRDE